MGAVISIIIYLIVAAIVLLIVDRLNLGLSVNGFGNAIIATAVIAVVSWVLGWLLAQLGIRLPSGLLGAILSIIVAAVVLMISDRFLAGMKVNGFSGAIVAAIAIASSVGSSRSCSVRFSPQWALSPSSISLGKSKAYCKNAGSSKDGACVPLLIHGICSLPASSLALDSTTRECISPQTLNRNPFRFSVTSWSTI